MNAALLAAALAGGDGAPAAAPPRDVIVVTLDTTRRDYMGFLGRAPSPTPALDGFAARALVFTDAATVAPLTLPAHTSLMTGLYPTAHGVHDNTLYRVPDAARTLAEILKEHGYATAAAVAAFVLDPVFGLDQGFDRYSAPPRGVSSGHGTHFTELGAREQVDRALGDLAQLARPGERPPFLYWLHLYDPHDPYAPESAPPIPAAQAIDPAAVARILYEAEIRGMDEQLGRLFDALERQGELARALIVVAADHGESLGDGIEATHGHFLFDPTIRIPLLLHDPASAPGRVTIPVSLVDVVPTLLARAGIDARGERFDGLDLSPWIADATLAPPDRVLPLESWMVWLNYGFAPFEGCVGGGLKYVRSQHEQLFDRAADPAEKRDLFAPGEPRALALRRRLDAAHAESGALARQGPGLSEADRAALAALGYAAGGGAAELPAAEWSTLPDAYAKLGVIAGFDEVSGLLDRSDWTQAIARLRELAAQEPASALFHEQLGMMLINVDAKNGAEAAAELGKALALDPRRGRCWFALARCLTAERVAARERADSAKARGRGREFKRAFQEERALEEKAERALRESLRLEPNYPDALMLLAQMLIEQAQRTADQPLKVAALYAEVEQLADRFVGSVGAASEAAKPALAIGAMAKKRREELEEGR